MGDTISQPQRQNTCFVCGQANPRGMQLRFESDDKGSWVDWTPSPEWEGFHGIIHGGIVSAVLDEAMAKAVAAIKETAPTAELRVRFRRPVNTGGAYRIRGWIVQRAERVLDAEAALMDADGCEYAHAWGRFIVLAKARKQEDTEENGSI